MCRGIDEETRANANKKIQELSQEGYRILPVVMSMLVFTSQFRVYIVRERRHWWSSLPSKAILIASLATIAGFALLGVYGLIIPPIALHQVLFILGFSALFTLSLDFPKYYVFRKLGL